MKYSLHQNYKTNIAIYLPFDAMSIRKKIIGTYGIIKKGQFNLYCDLRNDLQPEVNQTYANLT